MISLVLILIQKKQSPSIEAHAPSEKRHSPLSPKYKRKPIYDSLRRRRTVGVHAVDAPPDTALHLLGHLLERQLLLDALDGAGDGGLDALDTLLDGRGEEADVLLPAGRPLGGLAGHALLGAGHHHVERGEDADAGGAEEEDFGAPGAGETGNSGRHFCGLF